jgi:hypothetical protein
VLLDPCLHTARAPHTALNVACCCVWLTAQTLTVASDARARCLGRRAGWSGGEGCCARRNHHEAPGHPNTHFTFAEELEGTVFMGVNVTTEVWPESASAFTALVASYLSSRLRRCRLCDISRRNRHARREIVIRPALV